MRSIPSGSFERLSSLEALWRAYLRCRKGKRRQPRMAAFDLDADTTVCALHRELRAGTYAPGPYALRVIRDPKTRLIAAAPIRDRVVHQALVAEIGPSFERGFIDQSYAGLAGRGAQRAVLRYLGLTRRHAFRLSLDVRRYFPSIRHETLESLLFRRIRDPATRRLIDLLVRSGRAVYTAPLAVQALGLGGDPVPEGCGLPIGSYLSQWAGNVYLDGLDHHVKRALEVPGYLRYMDDFALFAGDEASLLRARDAVVEWLLRERSLTLNPKRWSVLSTSSPSVFLGYRVSRAGLAPARKIRRRLAARVRLASDKGHDALVRCLVAYRGILSFG